ncbi:MAG TPA: tetratricopeptide repeat protein [Myxococcales bacterium]|jgi:Tfp pilus assembly protein PilF
MATRARASRRTRRELLDAKLQDATRLASEGDFVRAEKLLMQVLKTSPKEIAAYDALGFVQFFQGRFSEAQECCERSIALAPGNAYAHKGWGLCVAKQGRVDEGLASLERAMALQPDWFDPYWDFLIVCGENRRAKEARKVLALARERFPEKRCELDQLVRHFRQ